jgi:hypothetical protein
MNNIARIYRAEILRAALGPCAAPAQAADLGRLNQIAERLAECEGVHGILRAKGYGAAGVSLTQIARDVPGNTPQVLKELFQPIWQSQPAPFAEWQTFSTEQIARYFGVPADALGGE